MNSALFLAMMLLSSRGTNKENVSQTQNQPPTTNTGNGTITSSKTEYHPMRFRPTRITPTINDVETQKRQYVEAGRSEALINCDIKERRPCQNTKLPVDRSTCERWRCCWKTGDKIPCSKPQIHITKLDTGDDEDDIQYDQCGVLPADSARTVDESTPDDSELQTLLAILAMAGKRIVGGEIAQDGEFPWVAFIYLRNSSQPDLCGGSLIYDDWVLTAAHCILLPSQPEEYGVILGEHDVDVVSGNEQYFEVSQIIRHPNYNGLTKLNDIALIKLKTPVVFNSFIRPICMVEQGALTDHSPNAVDMTNQDCTVIGWGHFDGTLQRSSVLRKLDLRIIPDQFCRTLTLLNVQKYDPASNVVEGDGKFCAGLVVGQDSCDGDSGGPLFCKNPYLNDGRYYLYGIVSYGVVNCGTDGLPGVYTKMASFTDWINQNTNGTYDLQISINKDD